MDSDYGNGIAVVGLEHNERPGLMAVSLREKEKERGRKRRNHISPKIYFKLARPIMRNSVPCRVVAVRFTLLSFAATSAVARAKRR